jgi:hypothetical protein
MNQQPSQVEQATQERARVVERYLKYLTDNPMEQKAMLIAKDHLGSSFDLIRSNGFQAWMKRDTDKGFKA